MREAGMKGLGLFLTRLVPTGTEIGEYTGQVLTAEAMEAKYPEGDAHYLFHVNDNYMIDASDPDQSSVMRYVNHSAAQPNVEPVILRKKKRPGGRVFMYTLRPCEAGEELLFDYGPFYWGGVLFDD